MATIARINIFPVKSCDCMSVPDAVVLPSGALQHDRQFALLDSSGQFINAKRFSIIHQLRLTIDPVHRTFRVARCHEGQELSGHLDEDRRRLSDWLSEFFGFGVSIAENKQTGFPDDLEANGPTVISTATLHLVATWFPGSTIEDVRLRFRVNVEIDGVPPFWEDRLCRDDKHPLVFQLGEVVFGGTNPCQRCVVPTRDPLTGEVVPPAFAQQFRALREQLLPDWSPRQQFNHFYRLSTNTRLIDRKSGVVRVGDWVTIADS